MLVARCEGFLTGERDLAKTIARLTAFAEAGADCLYAPGLKDIGAIAEVVRSVDRPVNANLTATGLSVADMAAVGVRRVSIGAALAKASYAHVDGLVALLRDEGRLP